MKKLTAFLEEEREKFNLQFCENYDWWITDEEPEAKPSLVKEWLKDHDTRLINFILDTVMEEIGKLYEPYEGEEQIMIEHHILDKVSTIINNLKVK